LFTYTVTNDREDYSYLDGAATQGHTYAYSVEALDAASPPNVSAASAQVSVRPRHSSVVAPSLSQAGSGFTVNTNGAPSLDGVPGSGQEDWDNTWAEDDDVMSFSMNITGGGTAVSYGIYRKAPDEDHYSLVGTIAQPTSGDNIFNDTTIVKGTYDYFVTRRSMVGSVLEESAGSTSVVGTDRPLPAAAASVRNLCVRDSRNEYTTANSESRVTRIYWSRVVEPDVRGYNVYRKCRFTGCGGFTYGMETFACEPAWTRVNASLLPPTTREFQDSSVGGLQGCFLYAVRPVGSSLDEGQITKVVGTALWARQTKGELHATSCDAVQGDYSDDQSFAYAEIAPAINSQARGSGSASAPVPAPQNVIRQQVFPKPVFEGQWSVSEVAQVTWSTQEPVPRDLKGFHVEMAGSPNGPWARLTKNPVAWWERHYSVQGSFDLNTHRATCASFRVIAIDEDGNESTATPAQYNPSPSSCPTTAPAPSNLRATTIDPPGTSQDATRLEWDASPAADEYYVYRLVNEPGRFFFYITAIVPAPPSGTPFFDEKGDWTSATCPYQNPTHDCLLKLLDVYYVTAR